LERHHMNKENESVRGIRGNYFANEPRGLVHSYGAWVRLKAIVD
jgi:hypothetical protein